MLLFIFIINIYFYPYIFCHLARICWGTLHNNGNPASCSLCFSTGVNGKAAILKKYY
jgi:hypothetical protein